MRPLRAQVSISELYAKAGREAEGIVRVGVVDCPVGAHTHEKVGVARKRRTEPPIPRPVSDVLFHAVALALENLKLKAVRLLVPPIIRAKNVGRGGYP